MAEGRTESNALWLPREGSGQKFRFRRTGWKSVYGRVELAGRLRRPVRFRVAKACPTSVAFADCRQER